MAFQVDRENSLRLRLGGAELTVFFRRPRPAELIETLAAKMPRGSEAEDIPRMLLANLELGRACVTGVGEGELVVDGAALASRPAGPEAEPGWREALAEACPLLLLALGQHLSAVPAFMEDPGRKKS